MFSVIIILISFNMIQCAVINRFDQCDLESELVTEIRSYENVTRKILSEVRSSLGDEMYDQYINFLDTFGARPSGTKNLENAIDHMINLTRSSGIQDVITEDVQVPHWVRVYESANLISPRAKKIALLGLGSSVSTPENGITAPVIVFKSFDELEKAEAKDVKGKIVIFNAPFVSYGETVQYRSSGASKASRKGAVASLIRSITPFSLNSPHTGSQYYDDDVVKIPAAAITIEDADLLQRLQESGKVIIIHLKMIYTYDTKVSRNTIVDIKGKANPEQQVIVSGHIDSWDVGSGAMDDGGGMMISWFAPIVLHKLNLKPKRTVRAILWTAEEPGLIGAAAYLKNHEQELPNINFIMESDEGTFRPLGLEVAGPEKALCIINEILKLFPESHHLKKGDAPGSDIVMFIRKGVPGASLMNDNQRYFWFHHSEGDTLNVQSKSAVIDCAAFWAAVSYVIADLSIDIPRT